MALYYQLMLLLAATPLFAFVNQSFRWISLAHHYVQPLPVILVSQTTLLQVQPNWTMQSTEFFRHSHSTHTLQTFFIDTRYNNVGKSFMLTGTTLPRHTNTKVDAGYKSKSKAKEHGVWKGRMQAPRWWANNINYTMVNLAVLLCYYCPQLSISYKAINLDTKPYLGSWQLFQTTEVCIQDKVQILFAIPTLDDRMRQISKQKVIQYLVPHSTGRRGHSCRVASSVAATSQSGSYC